MNEPKELISSDDPRLTAYALGELEGAELAVVEKAVRADPALQAVVAEIQAMGGELTQALADEDFSAAPQFSSVGMVSDDGGQDDGAKGPRRGKLLSFPALYYVFATAAAAGFAVMVAMHPPGDSRFRQKPAPMTVLYAPPERNVDAAAEAQSKDESVAAEVGAGLRFAEMPQRLVMPEAAKRVALPSVRIQAGTAADRAMAPRSFATEGGFASVSSRPLSTIPARVDTGSYADVRRIVDGGLLPPPSAVRIEEFLNYFPYAYPPPPKVGSTKDAPPFAASLEVASAPWAPEHRLVRVALKGREVSARERGAASVVFLIDVSGSMNAPGKLPLVKETLRRLLERLRDDDRIAIVTYAGESGLVLPATPAARRGEILAAIDKLEPAGSAQSATDIRLAYELARANQAGPGLTRVVLCTDGDFEFGATVGVELIRLVEENAREGVFLTALGFGMGAYRDGTLERLADKGRGTFGYVESPREIARHAVDPVCDALVTIARDVRIRVEFNPAQVAQYRLIGYEGSAAGHRAFESDAPATSEIGAGYSLTALYEVIPPGAASAGDVPTPTLRYFKPVERIQNPATQGEMLTVSVKYADPQAGGAGRTLDFHLMDDGRTFEQASPDFQFAAAVASFGMILKDSDFRGGATFTSVDEWARRGAAQDPEGYRMEFLDLVSRAGRIVR